MHTAEQLAEAKAYSARPHKENQPGQKFPRGARVLIAKDLGPTMGHFSGAGHEAIVQYTYAQKFEGSNIDSYSLVLLDPETGEPYNSSAWYHEDQLTLLNDDVAAGEKIIEAYEDSHD